MSDPDTKPTWVIQATWTGPDGLKRHIFSQPLQGTTENTCPVDAIVDAKTKLWAETGPETVAKYKLLRFVS